MMGALPENGPTTVLSEHSTDLPRTLVSVVNSAKEKPDPEAIWVNINKKIHQYGLSGSNKQNK